MKTNPMLQMTGKAAALSFSTMLLGALAGPNLWAQSAECAGVIITEIMYNPSGVQGVDERNEWVEILNDSCDPIDLAKWTIEDLNLGRDLLRPLDGGSTVLAPGQYALIIDGDSEVLTNPAWNIAPGTRIFETDDAAIGNGLNNGPETLTLRDSFGEEMDSVSYLTTDASGCGNEANGLGWSLERVDPLGPGDCSNFRSMELNELGFPRGGTPGARNYLWVGDPCRCVFVDIKPGSCPNPFNVTQNGVLPVALVGTADFDVTQVDPGSIRLAGVSPLRYSYEDVTTPSSPITGKAPCHDCSEAGPDGLLDLSLKFDAPAVAAALGHVHDGECVVLDLSGFLKEEFGGTAIHGEDVMLLLVKGKAK